MARVTSATSARNLPPAGRLRTAHGGPGDEGPESEASGAPPVGGAPAVAAWVPWTTLVLSALAVVDAAWLTYAHYTSASVLFCPNNGFVNCGLVTSSSYSHPFGVPVADAGLVWAIGMLVLCSPWGWRQASAWFGRLRLAGVGLGVLSVLYLLWAELIKLHHLCEYCTVMHVLTLALFGVVVFATALAGPAQGPSAAS